MQKVSPVLSGEIFIQVQQDDVLLVIDVQRDFCAGGRLAVQDGDAVVEPINKLMAQFPHVVLTQDWHPAGHSSFASSYLGRAIYETIQMSYGPQTLWPDHCVQGTPGAGFHPGLKVAGLRGEEDEPPGGTHVELIVRKGFRPEIDSYSAFFENDRRTPTGLAGYLRERGLQRIFLAGLAYDFCVRYSALDAVRSGFSAVVIEDACRAVGLPGAVDAAESEFAEAGVQRVSLADFGINS